MGLEFVNPENAPAPAANYSNLAIVPAGYRLLVIAGQIGNLSDGSIVDGLEAQYEQSISNINAIVASEDGTSIDIAKITIFLTEGILRWQPCFQEIDLVNNNLQEEQ